MISGCADCSCNIPPDYSSQVANALLSPDPLSGIRSILIGSDERFCRIFTSIGNDHFETNDMCVVAQEIRILCEAILGSPEWCSEVFPRMQITYLETKSLFFLSSFLKIVPKLPNCQSDLTGDGGSLVANEVTGFYPGDLSRVFSSAIDIGGQDSDCLEKKCFAKISSRTLVEINLVAPFLSEKTGNVKFYLGGITDYFSSEFFSKEPEGTKLFLMSNFVNVFHAKDAWEKLEFLSSKMSDGDVLAITTLSKKQGKKLIQNRPETYAFGESVDGISELRCNNAFYKSTVSDDFIESAKQRLRFYAEVSNTRESICQIRKKNGDFTAAPILYEVTIFRKRAE